MNKPREWESVVKIKMTVGKGMFSTTDFDIPLHVIEKSAYDELELKFKQTDEQNKRLRVDSKLERAQQAEAKLSLTQEQLRVAVEALELVVQSNSVAYSYSISRDALKKIRTHASSAVGVKE